MPQTIQDSLRDLLYLARNADIVEMKKEKSRLELRLSAVNRIIEWNAELNSAVELDAAPPPGAHKAPTYHSPPTAIAAAAKHAATSTGPAPMYDHDRNPTIVNAPSDPKAPRRRGPGKKNLKPDLPPGCVDEYDPPERRVDPDDPVPEDLGEAETEENVLEADTPEAIENVKEIAEATPEKRRFKFAELMSAIVMYLGKHGQSPSSEIFPAIGITRQYLGLLLGDERIKTRVRRAAPGVYELTESGKEMYEGLAAPAQTSWK